MNLASSTLLVATAVTALSARPAAAEDVVAAEPEAHARHYVAAGTMGGVDQYFRFGGTVEGGVRFDDSPLFGHLQIGAGESTDFDVSSTYVQVRAGLEARGCTGRFLCAFAGADAAFTRDKGQRDTAIGFMSTESFGVGLVPRAGLELGRKVRVRAGVEVPTYSGARGVAIGFAANLGLGYAF